MSTNRVGTVAAVIAGLALSAVPVLAQDSRREQGERRQGEVRGGRRAPRDAGEGGNRGDRGAQAERGGDRDNDGAGRPQAVPRSDARGRDDGRRAEPERGGRSRDNQRRDEARPYDNRRYDNRRYDEPRYQGRRYDDPRRYRDYRYYSHPPRSYVVPYGYRPRGYRPGWSLNLYFGRPYGPSYYGRSAYGYYGIPRGFAYGSLRIVDAPPDAQVFVDGYYAGVVDDYDGVFQRLNLEPGPHHIEIDVYPGAPPLDFDVHIAPGQTVTFRARY
jgi:hypothetical protein